MDDADIVLQILDPGSEFIDGLGQSDGLVLSGVGDGFDLFDLEVGPLDGIGQSEPVIEY